MAKNINQKINIFFEKNELLIKALFTLSTVFISIFSLCLSLKRDKLLLENRVLHYTVSGVGSNDDGSLFDGVIETDITNINSDNIKNLFRETKSEITVTSGKIKDFVVIGSSSNSTDGFSNQPVNSSENIIYLNTKENPIEFYYTSVYPSINDNNDIIHESSRYFFIYVEAMNGDSYFDLIVEKIYIDQSDSRPCAYTSCLLYKTAFKYSELDLYFLYDESISDFVFSENYGVAEGDYVDLVKDPSLYEAIIMYKKYTEKVNDYRIHR